MSQLRLHLLGMPEVLVDGLAVHLRTRKMLALLAYLATETGAQPRDELAELLWPGSTGTARRELRGALYHLQAALGHGAFLDVSRQGVELPHEHLRVDVLELAAAATDHSTPPDPAAVDLWRGAFLQGLTVSASFSWDEWVRARAAACGEHFDALLARLAHAQLADGKVWDAISTTRRRISHDPLNQDAHQLLARAQRAAGLSADALHTERSAREVFRRELGVDIGPESPGGWGNQQGATLPPEELPYSLVGGLLIGRTAEFARLAELYHRAAGGAPHAAVLSGEPGIGKTRLAGEVLAWAQTYQSPVLRGRSHETTSPPFAPVAEALMRQATHLRRELTPARLADLAWVLPGLTDSTLPAAPPDLRYRLLDAISAAILTLTPPPPSERPLVLLIDDLQWADASTMDALLHLAVRLSETPAPILLLFTARAEYLGTGSPLDGFLARLRRHLPLLSLPVGPLNAAETRHLLSGALPRSPALVLERLGAWLFGQTGGHPLYLTETIKSLLESGAVTSGPQGVVVDESHMPTVVEGVRAAIGERLTRLTPAALGLAQAAAVLGRGAVYDVLCAVADLDEAAALPGYEEALCSGLLVEVSGEGDRLATLSHDRVRETLRDALSSPRRRALHRRAFLALKGQTVTPATLAEHAALAGQVLEAAALFEQAACEAAVMGAYDEALTALERALSLVPATADHRETRLRLLDAIGHTLFKRDAGLSPALLERTRLAAACAGAAGLLAEQAGALNRYAADLLHAGRLDEAEPSAHTACHFARTGGLQRDEALALITLARVNMSRWNWRAAEEGGEEAVRLAERLGGHHEDVAIAASLELAIIRRWGYGALHQARAQIAALWPMAQAFAQRVPVPALDQGNVLHKVLWLLIWQDLLVGAYGEALDHLVELERMAGRPKDTILALRGLIHLRQGDLDAALAATRAAVDTSDRLHLRCPNTYGILAVCLTQHGRLDDARQALSVGQNSYPAHSHYRERADSALHFGDALMALGDLEGAQHEYSWALGTFSVPHVLGGLRGVGEIRAGRGDGAGAALCYGALLAHGAAGLYQEERARASLADLRVRCAAEVIDAALAEGATTPLKQVVQRVLAAADLRSATFRSASRVT